MIVNKIPDVTLAVSAKESTKFLRALNTGKQLKVKYWVTEARTRQDGSVVVTLRASGGPERVKRGE